jgi:iron-sulfur cluster assembly accessory protein
MPDAVAGASQRHGLTMGAREYGKSPEPGNSTVPHAVGRAMTVENITVETETHGVELTDAAALKARALLEQEGRDDMHLRIAVQPGGCAGLRYQLFFDDRSLDGDLFRDFHGLKVGVDRMSAPYLQGAVIDFVDSIEKQGFTIDNPNAGGSCACGDSFN